MTKKNTTTIEEVCNEALVVNLKDKEGKIKDYFGKFKRLTEEKLGIDHDINDMMEEMCLQLNLDKDVMKSAFKLAAKDTTLSEYETKSFEVKAYLEILQSV